jgi:hypothetical protein
MITVPVGGGEKCQQFRLSSRRFNSEISALMHSPPGDLYGVIRDAANPVEPWFFIPHNSRRIAKSRTIPAQFPQTQSRKWFVINMRRCGEQAVLGWGARGPGFKSRRPDQKSPFSFNDIGFFIALRANKCKHAGRLTARWGKKRQS